MIWQTTKQYKNSENATEKYDIFHKHLNTTIDKHAPLRYLTKNEMAIKAKPWLTKGIQSCHRKT